MLAIVQDYFRKQAEESHLSCQIFSVSYLKLVKPASTGIAILQLHFKHVDTAAGSGSTTRHDVEQVRQPFRLFEDILACSAAFSVTNHILVGSRKNITLIRLSRILIVMPGVFLMLRYHRVIIRSELRVTMTHRRVRVVKRHLAGIIETTELGAHAPTHAAARLARRTRINHFRTVNGHARCRMPDQ